ncbi:MAG TPA: VTT domain-containing protein [Opitutaceae bacterium]|nr:VTT domain-containing protein [Opitutaceae bacterium]
MSSEVLVEKRKLPVAKLALAAIVLLVGAALVLRGVDVRALLNAGMDLIRRVGPAAFFGAMMILPAFGAPLSAFTIPAGEAFAPQIGLPAVIALALAVLAVNLALSYWLARYALRPLLTGLIKRYGYSVPRVTPENALSVALLVRLTPGPPYALQCFVLGLAEVPFKLYMIVSWLAVLPWVVGAIILGQGIFNGNFKVAATGVGVLVLAVVAVQWVRKKYFRREG